VNNERSSLIPDARASLAPHLVTPPKPEVCGNCQADGDSIYWNATGGWACRSCGASDYEEAAE
jgi:ribosomal protein L37AE/L43A